MRATELKSLIYGVIIINLEGECDWDTLFYKFENVSFASHYQTKNKLT